MLKTVKVGACAHLGRFRGVKAGLCTCHKQINKSCVQQRPSKPLFMVVSRHENNVLSVLSDQEQPLFLFVPLLSYQPETRVVPGGIVQVECCSWSCNGLYMVYF